MANLDKPPASGGDGASQKKPRRKSARNLAIVLLVGITALVIVASLLLNPDMGQRKMRAEINAKNLRALKKQYNARIANPEFATKQAYANARDAIRTKQLESSGAEQLSQVVAPPSSANLPPPPTVAPSSYNRAAYGRAHKALQGATSADGESTRVGVAGAQGPSEPAFVVYVKPAKSTSLLSAAKAKPASNSYADAQQKINQDCQGDPACVAAEKNAEQAREQAMAQRNEGAAGGGPAAAGNFNSSWLYRNRNEKVGAMKNLVANTGKSLYWVAPGTVVNGVLESAIDTRLPGQIVVRVTSNVYDSRYGRYLVIPAGSTLTGTYNDMVQDGQHRVMVAMNTMITPSGGEVALGGMTLSDGLGRSGVPGDLHTHFFKRMGIAFLMGLEADEMDRLSKIQTVVDSPYGGGSGGSQQGISSGGQIIVSAANEQIKEMFALGPNITVPPGAVVSLMTSQGINIPPIANTR